MSFPLSFCDWYIGEAQKLLDADKYCIDKDMQLNIQMTMNMIRVKKKALKKDYLQ
jgi:hypothetical protein